jgi:hypothetical protein
MVPPWRITARIFALLPALAQPAAAGGFSVEEQKLVADIRQKMDQTTQLLIYAYENEEKMDLAEMKRVLASFRELSRFFSNIPDRKFERQTGSFCVGAASFVWSYWNYTALYKEYRGTSLEAALSVPKDQRALKERQKDLLEGHFWTFLKCRIHLQQISTQLEDKARAEKINIAAIAPIKKESSDLIKEIIKNKNVANETTLNDITKRAERLYRYYYPIHNIGISPGWLFCETLADKPFFIWKEYINRHGPNSKKEKLPTDLYNIGFNFLIAQYYTSVGLCDNHIEEYKKKSP